MGQQACEMYRQDSTAGHGVPLRSTTLAVARQRTCSPVRHDSFQLRSCLRQHGGMTANSTGPAALCQVFRILKNQVFDVHHLNAVSAVL